MFLEMNDWLQALTTSHQKTRLVGTSVVQEYLSRANDEIEDFS